MDVRLALIGLLVGLLVGISGVGGSSLMTPLLILALRVNPLVAVGTDLAYSVPTRLLGAYIHWRQKTVDLRVLVSLCLGGIPAAVLGIVALIALRSLLGASALGAMIKHAVGLLLFLAAATMILAPILSRRRRQPAALVVTWTGATRHRMVALGALVGFCVSLTSIGSGALTVPALYMLIPRLDLRRLVGSDVAFAAVLIPAAALGHLSLGDVNLTISANLLVGSLPGVFIGSKLCARLPNSWLRPLIAGTMVWAGASMV